ncbi:hypothetical protein QR676_16790 [Vibrio sp. TMPB1044]|uniref:hypothetical protein n=1 Tax=Vibrio sp. TMPB1044 TaxID=3051822 RepID=UPI00255B5C3D|nr:hypothetical protein [Vibrio sp. TMPB1044]MDL5028900.1 hypothetical protein [Vibrio sp. TMPB1044]MDN5209028.1 hypothetical protein [Vibrio sp. TMPB1044]
MLSKNTLTLYLLSLIAFQVTAYELIDEEKNQEDPTKIVTRLGGGYNGELTLNGSLGLDEARMVSGNINSDGSEWRIGGSWLFNKGIVNFNFKRNQYENDGESTSYNLGTFVPLSVFGVTPWDWQLFPAFGYNYTEGHVTVPIHQSMQDGSVLMPIESHGGYLGMLALKPINDRVTLMLGGGGSLGSNNTNNAYLGGGASYRIDKNQSINSYAIFSDSSQYGSRDVLAINYRYEFN